MLDLSLTNKNVSTILREENNEVIYQAWLFFTEAAVFVEDNIILMVPNRFIKNIIEERYLLDIETLYRNELRFNQFIIKVDNELAFKADTPTIVGAILKNDSVKSKTEEHANHKLGNIIEKINAQVNKIYDIVETASKNGASSVSCLLSHEPICREEIYWQVKDFMLNKGYRAELCKVDTAYSLNLYW